MDEVVVGLTAFALIVPVELPDKTFVATLLLATRHRPLPVWLGVVAAFGVQCLVAVAAGGLVGLLPERPVRLVAAGMFVVGAVVLVRQALRARSVEPVLEDPGRIDRPDRHGFKAATTSFLVLFTAEWGDLSQLLTMGLVASGRSPVAVFVGSWLGLAAVAGLGVLVGRLLLRYVNLRLLRYVAAGVCMVLALLTVLSTL